MAMFEPRARYYLLNTCQNNINHKSDSNYISLRQTFNAVYQSRDGYKKTFIVLALIGREVAGLYTFQERKLRISSANSNASNQGHVS